MEAEFGQPQWVFGTQPLWLCLRETNRLQLHQKRVVTISPHWTPQQERWTTIDVPFTTISQVHASWRPRAYSSARLQLMPTSIVSLDLTTKAFEVLRRSRETTVDAGYLAAPRAIEFPTEGGLTAHGYFYPPQNRDYAAPENEKPPLLVMSHGGPTSSSSASLKYSIQYWTSRGIAVLDVNYGGSSGYGRAYRERLNGQWGIVDVDDCVNGARYLVERGEVDGNRLGDPWRQRRRLYDALRAHFP